MKRALTFAIVSLMACVSLWAQSKPGGTQEDRRKWFREMTQYKHEFLAKELDLTKEQEAKFFPVYDKMENETRELNRQARKMEKSVEEKGDKATELEYEKAAEALQELKGKESAVEMRYFAEFKTILSKKQLFRLKQAERKFTHTIMNHHRAPKGSRPHKK